MPLTDRQGTYFQYRPSLLKVTISLNRNVLEWYNWFWRYFSSLVYFWRSWQNHQCLRASWKHKTIALGRTKCILYSCILSSQIWLSNDFVLVLLQLHKLKAVGFYPLLLVAKKSKGVFKAQLLHLDQQLNADKMDAFNTMKEVFENLLNCKYALVHY